MIILKRKDNGVLYEVLKKGEQTVTLQNIETGAIGEVANGNMQSSFSIPVGINMMASKNPNVLVLIKILNLSLTKIMV